MRTLPDALARFGSTDNRLLTYVDSLRPSWPSLLTSFLTATMDEVRLLHVSNLSKAVLTIVDLDDLEFIRKGVLRREITGDISFTRQRDHSAHTTHNWLLGWYLYCNSKRLRTAMRNFIDLRLWPTATFSHDTYFGHVWQYASLLHDIGYIFEGSIDPLEPVGHDEQAAAGVAFTREYFENVLWGDCGFMAPTDRKAILDHVEMKLPDFERDSVLSSIADTLRNLDDLNCLTDTVIKDAELRNIPLTLSRRIQSEGLASDAFELWRAHHRMYSSSTMRRVIDYTEKAFRRYMFEGMPEASVRLLDHGVCGGLLLLLIATFYYRLRYAIEAKRGAGARFRRLAKLFCERIVEYECDPYFWWTGIVWATSAVAAHNVLQCDPYEDGVSKPRLRLDDDPLTYLGILTDAVQHWDRYTVLPTLLRSPSQGVDVCLGKSKGIVVINYKEKALAAKVTKELDGCLDGWKNLIDIRSKARC